jgi:ribosome-binding protein aMBF1 (putative translation factor)|tara:strand:- start:1389 stop:1568 length:180 start_codon:yes stop_codon:yes gene_type:complete
MSELFLSDKERIVYSCIACELCKSTLAGERYIVVELDDNFNGDELEVCIDCALEVGGAG